MHQSHNSRPIVFHLEQYLLDFRQIWSRRIWKRRFWKRQFWKRQFWKRQFWKSNIHKHLVIAKALGFQGGNTWIVWEGDIDQPSLLTVGKLKKIAKLLCTLL